MLTFTYQFRDNLFRAGMDHYWQDGYHRYRIYLTDGRIFVIAAAGFPGVNGMIIWLQTNKPGEDLQPHDLVQVIGEGLEDACMHPFPA